MRTIGTVAVIAVACAMSGCKDAPAEDAAQLETLAPGWHARVVLHAPDTLGGCAVGDLDPGTPGNEIASVCSNGEWFVGDRAIGKTPGEMIQCAVGDVDPRTPGDEIVGVGMAEGTEDGGGAGAAWIATRTEKGWSLERIHHDEALLHGVAVGDVDDTKEGVEIVVVGFTKRAFLLSRGTDGWRSEVLADLPGAGKNAVVHDGGVAVACTDGSIVRLERGPEKWTSRVLDRAGAGQARLGSDGKRILAARDDGVLALVSAAGREEIHRESKKLRGAALADLVPDWEGLEAATAGYAGAVTVLRRGEKGWTAVRLLQDDAAWHHVAVGELREESPGLELVACGHGRRLVLFWHEAPR
jgi:hypothetical protein